MSYCVYKHTCPNNKVYIGITSMNPILRWNNGIGYKHNIHFYNAILKYGWDNIKHEILFTDLTKEEACEKEIELIAECKSNQREFGYNKSTGGESHEGCIASDELKKKLSKIHLGKKHSPETIRKMTESRIGKTWTVSLEGRQNIRNSKLGKPSNRSKILIYQYDLENNLIAIHEGYAIAAKRTGIHQSSIGNCCNGFAKTAGNYVFCKGEKKFEN